MRDAIAVTADVVTIVGVLALLAFLLNHAVTRRLGVWAGARRGERRYGWRRRQKGLRNWQQKAAEPPLRLLSRFGGETRQPMRLETPPWGDIGPDIAQLLAPYRRDTAELARFQAEQAAADQRLMKAAGERIDTRRWRRQHRRVRCDNCGQGLEETLLACSQDCEWSDKHPKHLSHTCNHCEAKREAAAAHPAVVAAGPPQPIPPPVPRLGRSTHEQPHTTPPRFQSVGDAGVVHGS